MLNVTTVQKIGLLEKVTGDLPLLRMSEAAN
jgi:hypothetical protein